MSIGDILSTLLLGPLKLIFEIIFALAHKLVGHPGLAIIGLSLVMNFLLLPLYKRTDDIQESARDTEEKLREGVAHIKKHFSLRRDNHTASTYIASFCHRNRRTNYIGIGVVCKETTHCFYGIVAVASLKGTSYYNIYVVSCNICKGFVEIEIIAGKKAVS